MNFTNITCPQLAPYAQIGKAGNITDYIPDFDPENCTSLQEFAILLANELRVKNGAKYSIIFIVICIPMLFIQLTSFPIFLIFKNYRKNTCFRILFANGLVDSIQLGTYLIYSFLNLFMKHDKMSPRVQQIGAAFSIPVWSIVVFQHLLLALNRLIVILRARYLGSKYIPIERDEKRIFMIALLFSGALFISLVGLFLSPYVGGNLDRGTMVFRFNDLLPYTRTYHAWIWWIEGWVPFICFGIYVFIIYTARKSRKIQQRKNSIRPTTTKANAEFDGKRMEESTPQQKANANANTSANLPLLNDYERRLLIQALILYSIMLVLMLVWHFIDECQISYLYYSSVCTAHFFGHPLFSLTLQTHSLVAEVPWMIYCGLSPILFLTMNKEFRARYLQLYTRKSPEELTQILSTTITFVDCSDAFRLKANQKQQNEIARRRAVSHDPAAGGGGADGCNGNGTIEGKNNSSPHHDQDGNFSEQAKRKMTA